MSLYLGETPICGGIEGNQLNNPFSLLDYKYSEYELSNASWLLSNGQFNSGATYSAVYDLLLAIYNGTETKAGVSVKLSTETYTDTDFVLNTSDTTFRLPLYTQRVLVKKYKNGQNTYNLYSDGWCEQSGSVQIPGPGGAVVYLNVPYADLEYELLSTPAQNIAEPSCVTNRTLTSFELDTTNGNTSPWVYWHTAGYANPPSVSDYTEIKGLYFYVGETVQDAHIIAAAGVLTDVTNLKNATNFSQTGLSTLSGLGMPSSTFDDLTLGANGSTYTAPANGYFNFRGYGYSVEIYRDDMHVCCMYPQTEWGAVIMPVQKGQIITILYNLTGDRNLRFYYAQGSESEAN